MARVRLSVAGYNRLIEIPDDWALMPVLGDTRPNGPLEREGFIEIRRTTTENIGPIAMVRVEWRTTEAGRVAITAKLDEMGYEMVDGQWVRKDDSPTIRR